MCLLSGTDADSTIGSVCSSARQEASLPGYDSGGGVFTYGPGGVFLAMMGRDT